MKIGGIDMDAAIIPAYNPEIQLIEVVRALYVRNIEYIIIVDDGSEGKKQVIFKRVFCRIL